MDPELEKYEALISRYLKFYEDLHYGRLRITSAQRRSFIGMIRGENAPEGDHEKAYAYHLAKKGTPVRTNGSLLPPNIRMGPYDAYEKWDKAIVNMAGWRWWND
ncbi:MAG: hypothetical protein V4521_09555 [Pseudomonadota bacterium]